MLSNYLLMEVSQVQDKIAQCLGFDLMIIKRDSKYCFGFFSNLIRSGETVYLLSKL